MQIGIGAWRWSQYYGRRLKRLEDHYDAVLASVQEAGGTIFEPFLPEDARDQERLAKALEKHGLAMPSIYRNFRLHEPGAEASFDALLQAARWAKEHGASQLTLNAEPIHWGKPLDKDDRQLRLQAKALHTLCGALAEEGVRVAYHIHDAELRHGARELHAMLSLIPAERMDFCLDPHWVFRGCGNSQVAVETIATLYRERICSLHLRQSVKGVFTEAFQVEGDLDYSFLRDRIGQVPTYIEQGWETGTPEALTRTAADLKGIEAVRVFLAKKPER
jgi:inosose dehydratase